MLGYNGRGGFGFSGVRQTSPVEGFESVGWFDVLRTYQVFHFRRIYYFRPAKIIVRRWRPKTYNMDWNTAMLSKTHCCGPEGANFHHYFFFDWLESGRSPYQERFWMLHSTTELSRAGVPRGPTASPFWRVMIQQMFTTFLMSGSTNSRILIFIITYLTRDACKRMLDRGGKAALRDGSADV